ncbi:LysR family transcriptional regulator [Oceanirhabdus sp. W0125-5]|uniref:LysR family transcriptional regulator n=1 Tax=Oceanirhabdus sp. W0125-5 TaxID=2999116 RepID=UPI0022F2B2F9|nr:LysR family transcriptional regulator [Oceanirhabdus sp. W0125-5]WBW97739.1 LysR family transcriptional regulator [Oceanirhabdus sp. W0125-5]
MEVNFELYKVFYNVVKEGQISAAAKKLFISQPAVSQSIKQLEEKLGGKVFFRTPKGMKLTSEGQILYKYIEKAYGFIIAGESKFQEMQNLEYGEIVIGASDTLCSHYLLPYLEKFHKEFPQIKIKVTNRTTYEILKLLKNGSVDLGILNLPIEEDKNLEIIETMTLEDCFICGDKYYSEFKDKVSLEQLNAYPLILLEKGSNTRRFIDKVFSDNNILVEPEIELGSVDLLVKFAKIGLGISFVTKNFIHDEIDNKEVYEIKLKEEIPKRKVGVVTLKGVPLSPSGKKFFDFLMK